MSLRSRNLLVRALIPLVVGLVVIAFVPLEMPVGMDFSQVLLSAQNVLTGRTVYGVGVSQVSTNPTSFGLEGVLPYPGPPWSFPLLLPLGLFSPGKAAAIWAVTTVLCLCAAIAFVSPGVSGVSMAILAIMALVSAPVQGHLIVGQFTIMAVLGLGLLIAGYRERSSLLVAVGFFLLTFRPHLGLPIVLISGLFLLFRDRKGLTQAIAIFVSLIVCLNISALMIDSTCVSGYWEYLERLNSLPSNKVCDTCSSLPVLLTDRSPDAPNSVWTERFILSGVSLLALGSLLLRVCRSFPLVTAGAACVSLLSAPYNRNYDFVLLVLPLVIVGREAWRLKATAPPRASLALALTATGALVSGVIPYALSRTGQGYIMGVGALCVFAATLAVARGRAPVPGEKPLS